MKIWNDHTRLEILVSIEAEMAKAQNEIKCAYRDVDKASNRVAFVNSAVHNLKQRLADDKDIDL